MADYDLLVIGSGPAGEHAAAQAASWGKRVVVIEAQANLGGASVNTGTLPSKTLRESALYLSGLKQRGLYGVDYRVEGGVTADRFLYREAQVVRKQVEQTACHLERANVDVIHGRAVLTAEHTVRVDMRGGGTLTLCADFILIGTGSHPHRPESIPFDEKVIYDSDTILRLDAVPGSLTVLGGGTIGCEYACLFAALGVEVVLVDPHPHLLPFLDGEIAESLLRRMKRLGIEFLLEEETATVEIVEGRVRSTLKSGNVVETEKLLYAAGRSGSSTGLGLEALGIVLGPRGHIQVNEDYQTAVPHVYAVGDVIGFPSLASTSMEQGRIAVGHAFQRADTRRLDCLLPYGLYTIPEVSMAGATEERLRKDGTPYQVGRASYADNARGQIIGDTEGLLKLLFSPDDGKLLGVHMIGESATELVHIGTICLHLGGTIDCFRHAVFNFPTLADAYKQAALDGCQRREQCQT